jgi:hypothetical protein
MDEAGTWVPIAISILSLGVSALALFAGPSLSSAFTNRHRVTASIRSLDSAQIDHDRQNSIHGREHTIQIETRNTDRNDDSLWVIIRSLNQGKSYARSLAMALERGLTIGSVQDEGRFQVAVYGVPSTVRDVFREIAETDEGLESLPHGVFQLDVISVHRVE